VSKAARDPESYIEQALEDASRIRVWLIDNKAAPGETRKVYGTATETFDAISCLARGGADRTGEEKAADRNRAQAWASRTLGIPQPELSGG
jgi:hypothetical protein